jgi:hypothetical protein
MQQAITTGQIDELATSLIKRPFEQVRVRIGHRPSAPRLRCNASAPQHLDKKVTTEWPILFLVFWRAYRSSADVIEQCPHGKGEIKA